MVEEGGAGAYDFITKPMPIEVVEVAVLRALEHLALTREVRRLRPIVDRGMTIDGIAGGSPAIRGMVEMIARVADTTRAC